MSIEQCGLLAISAVYGAFWRRWYGGGFWDVSRFWKYLALIGFCLIWQHTWTDWHTYVNPVLFAIFWAVSHGAWFVYWDHSDSAEGRKPVIDRILWYLVGVDESRTELGNCLGMCIRYTLTSIGLAFTLGLPFLFAGMIVAMCYVPAGIKHNTHIGEYLAGGTIFFLYGVLS